MVSKRLYSEYNKSRLGIHVTSGTRSPRPGTRRQKGFADERVELLRVAKMCAERRIKATHRANQIVHESSHLDAGRSCLSVSFYPSRGKHPCSGMLPAIVLSTADLFIRKETATVVVNNTCSSTADPCDSDLERVMSRPQIHRP